jgi:hypothetical protein
MGFLALLHDQISLLAGQLGQIIIGPVKRANALGQRPQTDARKNRPGAMPRRFKGIVIVEIVKISPRRARKTNRPNLITEVRRRPAEYVDTPLP